jgi:hypothetical protein
MKKYLPRVMDLLLREELQAFGGVLQAGPKWCAKQRQRNRLRRAR